MHTRAYCILSALPTALGARVSQAKLFLIPVEDVQIIEKA